MKKNKIKILFLLLLLSSALLVGTNKAYADWWYRPETRPTQPSFERPTLAPLPTQSVIEPTTPGGPTSPPSQPTVTPRVGGAPSSTPTPVPSDEGTTDEDPCASGKSFTGPYCGWSPRVGGDSEVSTGITGEGGIQDESRVLGLSYTSGWELLPSDIILLSGILCLLLYARSKLNIRRQIGRSL